LGRERRPVSYNLFEAETGRLIVMSNEVSWGKTAARRKKVF